MLSNDKNHESLSNEKNDGSLLGKETQIENPIASESLKEIENPIASESLKEIENPIASESLKEIVADPIPVKNIPMSIVERQNALKSQYQLDKVRKYDLNLESGVIAVLRYRAMFSARGIALLEYLTYLEEKFTVVLFNSKKRNFENAASLVLELDEVLTLYKKIGPKKSCDCETCKATHAAQRMHDRINEVTETEKETAEQIFLKQLPIAWRHYYNDAFSEVYEDSNETYGFSENGSNTLSVEQHENNLDEYLEFEQYWSD